jgi:hypothetical protein
MTKKVFSIDTQPGVQRDGTYFDKNFYTDGKWVRFQRGRPRKVGGYRAITTTADGLSRGIYVNSEDGINKIFNGYDEGIEVIDIDNNGIGSGTNEMKFGGDILTLGTITGGSAYTNGTYTGVALTGGTGTGAVATIVVAGNAVTTVTITTDGNYYCAGDVLTCPNTSIGGTGSGWSVVVSTVDDLFSPSTNHLWQFDSMFDSSGAGNNFLLAHPGHNLTQIDSTVSTAVLGGPLNGLVLAPLKDVNGTAPTGDTISVSGGVVVLHPYVFVYGDNGLIKNSVAGDPYDWNGPDSNETNVASTKVVKGLPVRGGSNAPSGLFWSLDSLIRVSYNPTTITVGGTPQTFYWRYDIISSQSSILSSQGVIEYDGIYYWCGVDRFLMYNGVVKEIPNSFNQNYFFDNLNYTQRQKVWATKVPRFGEIWWFYPEGDSEECNNVIIYNVRENCWYDGGFADGCKRTAGYFSQVFRFPVNAGSEQTVAEVVYEASIGTTNGSNVITVAVTNQISTYLEVVATGIPAGAVIKTIAPSATAGYFDVALFDPATGLDVDATATGTVTAEFTTLAGRITIWQHEFGTDMIIGDIVDAIESMFETSDLGWVGGGPSQSPQIPQGGVGENKWLRLERIEPDFVQSGTMSVQIVGRPFAQKDDVVSDPYYFEPDTGKVDMREQRRELRLRFTSNVAGGDYQMGKVLLSAELGDTRPFGS